MDSTIQIMPARTPDEIARAAQLFHDYETSIGIDLCFQGFAEELAGLPGAYAPPGGELLLAIDAIGQPLGCVAMRRLDASRCEMKRLFVTPAGRGTGLGRALTDTILGTARMRGYSHILLDTLPFMTQAIDLYRRLGFRPAAPYQSYPQDEMLCFSRALD